MHLHKLLNYGKYFQHFFPFLCKRRQRALVKSYLLVPAYMIWLFFLHFSDSVSSKTIIFKPFDEKWASENTGLEYYWEKNHFLVTFSSFSTSFAIINTTNAMTTKFITAPRKCPHDMTTGPRANLAACHSPPGMNGVMSGRIMSLTHACIKTVAATPMMNAVASPITLYSSKKSLNSCSILMNPNIDRNISKYLRLSESAILKSCGLPSPIVSIIQ